MLCFIEVSFFSPYPVVTMIERSFVRIKSGLVHVAACGAGRPILLLHQTPRSWDEYRDVMKTVDSAAERIAGVVARRGANPDLIVIDDRGLVGLPAVWIGSRSIASLLFGVTPLDAVTIAGAILVLLAAAQLAAYLPARRAARVDPLEALRHE